MGRIINGGLVYDTEKATLLCACGSSTPNRFDHGYWEGELYATPGGHFFVQGAGGPTSLFARGSGNQTSGGYGIRVVDEYVALDLAERFGVDPELLAKFWRLTDA